MDVSNLFFEEFDGGEYGTFWTTCAETGRTRWQALIKGTLCGYFYIR